ncbi:hypothetical protein BaRGS_00006032 [Batillaria attramentaria]|uniref:Uncharacterized protein n=1 Tax=Batillaria attramentaria TaxID=370345 RepID=A0ABD0LV29_9CAEN
MSGLSQSLLKNEDHKFGRSSTGALTKVKRTIHMADHPLASVKAIILGHNSRGHCYASCALYVLACRCQQVFVLDQYPSRFSGLEPQRGSGCYRVSCREILTVRISLQLTL